MGSTAPTRHLTDELQALLAEARLPTMPSATLRIMELAADPQTSLEHVAAVIATDPTLSGRTLGLANSALYNRGAPFDGIERAVAHLGVMRIRSVALALQLFATGSPKPEQSFDYGYFWRYCLTSAVAAKLLATRQGHRDPEEAFAAGLLQDIGVLAFQRAHPEEYAEVFTAKAGNRNRLTEQEAETWGFDHAELGAAIASHWGLPDALVEAIRHHHRPQGHALAELCELADLIHALIFEADRLGGDRLLAELRDRIGDENALLLHVEIELPHIAEACACPSWTAATEEELKARIGQLLAEPAA